MNIEQKPLAERIASIDNGRFKELVGTLSGLKDYCEGCYFFHPDIKDPRKGYRCKCTPSCPAATIHPNVQSYWHWKLGWITQEQHHDNLGIVKNPTQ